MPNKYLCSDGSQVTEATIKANLSKAYRKRYAGEAHPVCRGCGSRLAQGSAHSIPKARLKQLGLTDYIWNPKFFWPACHHCNSIAEQIYGEDFRKLLNEQEIVELIRIYDPERYQKINF